MYNEGSGRSNFFKRFPQKRDEHGSRVSGKKPLKKIFSLGATFVTCFHRRNPWKNRKSKLLEPLTNQVGPAEDVPPTAAWIVDGMAILQSLKEIPSTFEDLAIMIFDSIAPQSMVRRVDFVTDRYLETSIKNAERARQGSYGSLKVRLTDPRQKCPKQWGEQDKSHRIPPQAVVRKYLGKLHR